MPEQDNPVDTFAKELHDRAVPGVGLWNRLEGRPRTTEFGEALRAEVRDPLWMLTRQWQLGEFQGSDGGSPVTAQYSVRLAEPTSYRPPGGVVEPIPNRAPLEAIAERRVVPFDIGPDEVSFDLRLAIGRQWIKLLSQKSLLGLLLLYRDKYIDKYKIELPDPKAAADDAQVAHPAVWSSMQAMAGRAMDGYKLYRFVKAGNPAWKGVAEGLLDPKTKLAELGDSLVKWFDNLIDQPGQVTDQRPNGNSGWDPVRLEHRFSVAAAPPGVPEKVLTAQEYPGGTLDWHAFSVDPDGPIGGSSVTIPAPRNRTVFPAPVRFSGMPLPRWWAVEDGKTNFAAVRPDSTDLARLIFLEFALVYSNDWFQVPCDLPAGTLASVQSLVVTDVFGIQQTIAPAGSGDDEDWQRWAMFTLDTIGNEHVPADTDLFLPSSVPKVAEGPALEEVALIRDENANMVWGIEKTIALATGDSRRGSEVVSERLTYRLNLLGDPTDEPVPTAPVVYEVMSTVPENWIPFIAVHVPNEDRAIRLQRAVMTSLAGGNAEPQTDLLRENLDGPKRTYFINEEEVTQAGTRLTVAYNRTRWRDGRAVVWLSAKRSSGRGEGSSGLAFDHLVDASEKKPTA
ncbi:hypothetical protein OG474_30750 [Kribbella sp. NBC_01505]|uniref:hypothetical protein n=1 Tax=Kribbella sp. NBC_01505 TaxID=2903580 RepID=UPI00386F8412